MKGFSRKLREHKQIQRVKEVYKLHRRLTKDEKKAIRRGMDEKEKQA